MGNDASSMESMKIVLGFWSLQCWCFCLFKITDFPSWAYYKIKLILKYYIIVLVLQSSHVNLKNFQRTSFMVILDSILNIKPKLMIQLIEMITSLFTKLWFYLTSLLDYVINNNKENIYQKLSFADWNSYSSGCLNIYHI